MTNAFWLRGSRSTQSVLQGPIVRRPSEQPMPSGNTIYNSKGRREFSPLFVSLFILSILVPVHFVFGPVVVHSYRVVLLVAFVPCFAIWVSKGAGGMRSPDLLLICFVAWASISLVVAHGVAGTIEPSGVLLIETVGSYLIARVFVRTPAHFRSMTWLLFLVVLILVPLAVIESLTSRSLILDLLRPIVRVHGQTQTDIRWGLHRAQSVFPHPIHYGVFCASTFALTFYAVSYKYSQFRRLAQTGVVGFATALSLSTGALVAVAAQAWLIVWDYALKGVRRRWALLGWMTVAAYVVVDLLSNRTPVHVFVSYLTFNVGSSYTRIHIWNFGTAEVARHPLFGIGFSDWERPAWLSSSVDNFWLLIAMRHGLPALLFFTLAIGIIIYRLARLKLTDPEIGSYRNGLLVTLGGLIIAGATVHYWNHIYALFMFLVGSGVWMLDDRQTGASQRTQVAPKKAIRSSH